MAYIAKMDLPWDLMENRSVLITGASGMIGSFLVDSLMYINAVDELNRKVIALVHNFEMAEKRFLSYRRNGFFK